MKKLNYLVGIVLCTLLIVFSGISCDPEDEPQAPIGGDDPPTVSAGGDRIAEPGDETNINGSASDKQDSYEYLTILWKLIKPPESNAELTEYFNSRTKITPDVYGVYTLILIVTDTDDNRVSDTAYVIATGGDPPIADAGDDMMQDTDIYFTIDAGNSYDPEGIDLIYKWKVIDKPYYSYAGDYFGDDSKMSTTFRMDEPGEYLIELMVSDNMYEDKDTLMITSNPTEITGIDPTTGEIGINVNIYGKNLSKRCDNTIVRFFNGIISNEINCYDGSINAEVPIGAQTGVITVEIIETGQIAISNEVFTIIESSDWNSSNLGSAEYLLAVHSVDDLNGMILSQSNKIFFTEDGGDSWTPKPISTSNFLYDLFFITEDIGMVVGKFGSIYRTTNGGDSWGEIESNTNEYLNGIDFIDDQKGWICGGGGKVLYTVNAGESWEDRSVAGSYSFNDICFVNDTIGTTVGFGGMVWRTIDGGLNWVRQTNGVIGVSLHSVHFIDSETGSAVGEPFNSEGMIINTINGGSTWVQSYSGFPGAFNAIHFVNANYRYIVGQDGAIYYTTNSGSTWQMDNSGTTKRLLDITQMGNGKLIIVGENGIILKKNP